MLSRVFRTLFLQRQLVTNILVGITVLLYGSILFIPLASRAEKSSGQDQKAQGILEQLSWALALALPYQSPVKGQTPFQTLEKKVKSLGYTLDSFMPESDSSTSQTGRSILETAIVENVKSLIVNYGEVEGIKKSTTLSDSEKKVQLQNKILINKTLNKGLNEIKSRYFDKFKSTLENKMDLIMEVGCRTYSGGTINCEMKDFTTMSKLKETGLKKNTALGKAFSEGALIGLLDPNLILSEEEYNQRNNIEDNTEETNDEIEPVTETAPPKNAKDCATKSLDIYRKKIESISKSNFVGFITEGEASPCRLLRLSYTIQEKPFKRILKEGTIFDWNGKTMTLDQKAFDGILQSWGVLNGAKSSKSVKNKDKILQKKSNGSSGKR